MSPDGNVSIVCILSCCPSCVNPYVNRDIAVILRRILAPQMAGGRASLNPSGGNSAVIPKRVLVLNHCEAPNPYVNLSGSGARPVVFRTTNSPVTRRVMGPATCSARSPINISAAICPIDSLDSRIVVSPAYSAHMRKAIALL